ncbi:hypothetical protein AGMMS50256_13260 [Betaproteobacteria bacterium]|nr:hypothetical protein AGMMS50256_13260 [Betaproteobacteria bacterium]
MKWVVCLDNTGYELDLEPRKLYQVVEDEKSAKSGCIRIIDGSGEDYLYDANRFMTVEVAAPVEERLKAAA